jgi:hypothetical protein
MSMSSRAVKLPCLFHEARGSHQQIALGRVHLDEDVDVAPLVGIATTD